jgi:putative transposase
VQRLVGSIRRELLDKTLFWTARDLENKLLDYQAYYNEHRCHAGRAGATPVDSGGNNSVAFNDDRWKKHCRGLFELPVAA